jgi:glycosyltransferase 2 family protein
MLKTIFLNTLKVAIVGGLIVWLISSGKLDFKLLIQLQHYPFSVLLATILTLVNICFVSMRWRKILDARSKISLPLDGMIKVSWIGQFFSSVLPGSVSGDLVKIFICSESESRFF